MEQDSSIVEGLLYEAGLTAQGCWDQMDDYDRAAVLRFGRLVLDHVLKNVAHEIQYVSDWDVGYRITSKVRQHYSFPEDD